LLQSSPLLAQNPIAGGPVVPAAVPSRLTASLPHLR
jgi:hypothetical protein